MNPAHRIRRSWSQTSFIVVREKLGLVSCHINLHRALALAALTRKTQVECILYCFAFPPIFDRLTADHFAEQPRAAACRVLLLPRHHVTRTHRSAMMTTAHAGADATLRRLCETMLVVGIREMCFHHRRIPTAAQT